DRWESALRRRASARADGNLWYYPVRGATSEIVGRIVALTSFRSVGRFALLLAVDVTEQIRDPQLALLRLAQKSQSFGYVRAHALEEKCWVIGAQLTGVVVAESLRFAGFRELHEQFRELLNILRIGHLTD